MSIESKLDEVMQVKEVTVDQLIEKTGLPRMTIFNARRGLNVTIKTAIKISEALNVPTQEIWSLDSLELKEEDNADIPSG